MYSILIQYKLVGNNTGSNLEFPAILHKGKQWKKTQSDIRVRCTGDEEHSLWWINTIMNRDDMLDMHDFNFVSWQREKITRSK